MRTQDITLKKQRAFTLVEMLIVVIIISVLAGLFALSIYRPVEKAKEVECQGERRQIATAFAQEYDLGEGFSSTLTEVISNYPLDVKNLHITSEEATCEGLCKSGGIYKITPYGVMHIKVTCSVHGEQALPPSGPNEGHYVYNTNGQVQIADENYWETMDDFNDFYKSDNEQPRTFPMGTVIYVDGACYIAMNNITIKPYQWNTWSQYFNDGVFMKIKSPEEQSTPVDWNTAVSNGSTTYPRGSICYYNGSYYVANYNVTISSNPDWKTDPVNNPGAWAKL